MPLLLVSFKALLQIKITSFLVLVLDLELLPVIIGLAIEQMMRSMEIHQLDMLVSTAK